jgi:thiol-disulfide isomerase/thioredoxin
MHKTAIYLAVLALFAWACQTNAPKTETSETKTEKPKTETVGKTHPRQPSRTISDSNITVGVYNFEQFKTFLQPPNSDTLYIFNFWATWCAPCVAELPYFVKAAQANGNKPVKIILVSLDFEKDLSTRFVAFLKKRQMPLEVIALVEPDANSWISKIDSVWDGAIPATLFYKGEKRGFFEQSFEQESLDSVIQVFSN